MKALWLILGATAFAVLFLTLTHYATGSSWGVAVAALFVVCVGVFDMVTRERSQVSQRERWEQRQERRAA